MLRKGLIGEKELLPQLYEQLQVYAFFDLLHAIRRTWSYSWRQCHHEN